MPMDYSLVSQVCSLLGNHHFPLQLSAAFGANNIEQNGPVFLHIEASLGLSTEPTSSSRTLLVFS